MSVTAIIRTNLDLTETLRVAKGLGIGALPDAYPVLRVGDGAGAPVSASGTMAIRCAGGVAELSVNGGAWGAFGALPNVGPGAALYGGNGVASVTLDAQGRVTALATATYALASSLSGYMPTTWTLTANGGLTGGGSGAANRTVSIATAGVTSAMLRDSAALSVVGRTANSTGVPADITAGTDGFVLRRSGTTLDFGTVATAGIADAAVTSAKLRSSVGVSVIGRSANSTGVPADITAAADGVYLHRVSGVLGFSAILDAELPGTIMRTSAISIATGRVAYATATNTIGGSAALVYDDTTGKLTAATLLLSGGGIYRPDGIGVQIAIGNGYTRSYLAFELYNGAGSTLLTKADGTGSLMMYNGSGGASVVGAGGFRYNEAANKIQWSQNNSAWVNLDAMGAVTITAGNVAYATATNTLGGSGSMTFDPSALVGTDTIPLLNVLGRVFANSPALASTSGALPVHRTAASYTSTSGTAVFYNHYHSYTVNRPGSAGGTFGFYVSPTITSKGSGYHVPMHVALGEGSGYFRYDGDGSIQLGPVASLAGPYASCMGIRYNGSTSKAEWFQNGGSWRAFDEWQASTPPVGATYWVATADATLTAEVVLGSLSTGLLKNTSGSGVPTIAVAGSDYLSPSAIAIATGQVAFGTAANVIGGSTTFKWDNTNERLGIRLTTPRYTLEVCGPNSADQIHVSNGTADSGAWIGSAVSNDLNLAAGASWTGAAYTAKATSASIAYLTGGEFQIYGNSGLTVSSSFVPVMRAKVAIDGALSLFGATNTTNLFAPASGVANHSYNSEANPRWQVSRDGAGANLSAILFGPGGASTLAAAGAGVGYVTTGTLGLYVSNGSAISAAAQVNYTASTYRFEMTQTNSQIRIAASGNVGGPGTLTCHRLTLYTDAVATQNYSLGVESSNMWFNTNGGFKFYTAGALLHEFGASNIGLFSAGSYGGGAGVVFLKDRTTAPTSNPTGGGLLFSEGGALMWRNPSGIITVVAP